MFATQNNHNMRIQDIRALEERISDAVSDYLMCPDGYSQPVLHVYLDQDDMTYKAEVDDNLIGTEDDGVYPIASVLTEDGTDSDYDAISRIANSWIFLEH